MTTSKVGEIYLADRFDNHTIEECQTILGVIRSAMHRAHPECVDFRFRKKDDSLLEIWGEAK